MNVRFSIALVTVTLGLVVCSARRSCADAEPQEIGFSLYSWPQGGRWEFAVFEGSSTVHSTQEMRSKAHRLDQEKLKGRIAALPTGEKLYWHVDKHRGLVLPPKEVVHDIDQFSTTAGVILLLPGQTRQDKSLETIQTDVNQMKDP